MNQTDAQKKIAAMNSQSTIVIYFTDGERHLAPVCSARAETDCLVYTDVHTAPNSTPIRVKYEYILFIAIYTDEVRKTDRGIHFPSV